MITKINFRGSKTTTEYTSSEFSLTVYGDLVGLIENSEPKYSEESNILFSKIKDFEELENYLFKSIGSFFVVASKEKEVRLYSSLVHQGFYYSYEKQDQTCLVSEEESDLVNIESKVRSFSLKRIGRAHHGLARFPLNSLFDDIQRCPPGAYVSFNQGLTIVNYVKNIYKNKLKAPKLSEKFFENRLKSIMKAYQEFYGEVSLFMSGGIDSSLLLAIAVKHKIRVKCYYLPYSGLDENNHKIAEHVTKALGEKLYIVKRDDLDYEQSKLVLAERASSGPASLLKNKYRSWYKKESISPRIGITGQNLDSMYHIDTFAPNTQYTGLYRFLVLLKSSRQRFKYTALNVVFLNLKSKLMNQPEIIMKPFEHTLNSDEEHVKTKELVDLNDLSYSNYKDQETQLLTDFLGLGKHRHFTSFHQNSYFKLIKFFRFVQNTYSNYFALKKSEKIIRLNPYGEAPFLTGLMSYILPLDSIFRIKKFSHSTFKSISGIHHNKMVRQAVSYSIFKDINSILKYLTDKFSKKREPLEEPNFLSEAKNVYKDLLPYIDISLLKMSKQDRDYIDSLIDLLFKEDVIDEKKCDEVIKVIGTLAYLTKCYRE